MSGKPGLLYLSSGPYVLPEMVQCEGLGESGLKPRPELRVSLG